MRHRDGLFPLFSLALGLVTLVFLAGGVCASMPEAYEMTWWSIDNGGAIVSTGGSYMLGATIGQPDAGTLHDDSYTLMGGFWAEASLPRLIYLPLIQPNPS